MKQQLFIITLSSLILFSCKEEGCTDPIAINYNSEAEKDDSSCEYETSLTIDFTQTVNGQNLEQDNIIYTNEAGQNYSVKTLWYIISDIKLHTNNGNEQLIKDVHFIDIDNPSTLSFNINDLENGNYTSISYTMGLDTNKNISNKYLNEDFHTTMYWPDMMGGGYHYMKLEGNFDNETTFYNTHTGGTGGVDFSFNHTENINLTIDNSTSKSINIAINMEVNNWYNTPNIISLTTDGIMGDSNKQMLLKANGNNVFSTTIN